MAKIVAKDLSDPGPALIIIIIIIIITIIIVIIIIINNLYKLIPCFYLLQHVDFDTRKQHFYLPNRTLL